MANNNGNINLVYPREIADTSKCFPHGEINQAHVQHALMLDTEPFLV